MFSLTGLFSIHSLKNVIECPMFWALCELLKENSNLKTFIKHPLRASTITRKALKETLVKELACEGCTVSKAWALPTTGFQSSCGKRPVNSTASTRPGL